MIKILNLKSKILNLKSGGFTLIELAVYMGILTILLLILTRLFVAALDIQIESQATSGVEQDGRFIVSRLTYDIVNADSVTVPAAAGGQGINLQIVKNGISYSYTLNGSNLTISDDSGTDNLNSSESNVSTLSFKRINYTDTKPTIQINFTLTSVAQKTTGSTNETQSFQTTVGLR